MSAIPIYIIVHIDNLDFVVQNETIVCPNHPNSDDDYKSIGNNDIIRQRSSRNIPNLKEQLT